MIPTVVFQILSNGFVLYYAFTIGLCHPENPPLVYWCILGGENIVLYSTYTYGTNITYCIL